MNYFLNQKISKNNMNYNKIISVPSQIYIDFHENEMIQSKLRLLETEIAKTAPKKNKHTKKEYDTKICFPKNYEIGDFILILDIISNHTHVCTEKIGENVFIDVY